MSIPISSKTYLFNSQLGNVAVTLETVEQFDVEDIMRDKAYSVAMAVKFINVGKEIDANIAVPTQALPSVFQNNEEELLT